LTSKKVLIDMSEEKQELKELKELIGYPPSQFVEEEGYLIEKLPFDDTEVFYIKDFIPAGQRDELYKLFFDNLRWDKGPNRDTCLYGDIDVLYPYAAGTGYGESIHPLPWTADLLYCKELVERVAKASFDVCYCSWYRTGKKFVGFHSDRSELGKDTPIASISLGAERLFEFRDKAQTRAKYRMTLHNGSLLVMGKRCQELYVHALMKEPSLKDGRINLTFRHT